MRKTLLLFTVLLFGLQGWATTFTVDGVTYTITDATNKTVAIGTEASYTPAISTSATGTFTIPSSVSYNGDNYVVTVIGNYAFYKCSVINSVTIPNTVTTIGYYAFQYCSKLASIIIPSTITLIKGGAFLNFYYPITVEDNNPNYSSLDGILYNKSKTTLIQCPCSKGQVTIPNTVTTLEIGAFQDNWNLTSIIIPSSVTTIGNYAFNGCIYLTSVNIPISVTSIGTAAFVYSSLTSINIPSSVTSIGYSAFAGVPYSGSCVITVDKDNPNYSSLDSILYDKAQTKLIRCPTSKKLVNIPSTVTTIGEDAFRYGSLTSITIPSSVKTIENDAFLWCHRLRSVSIPSSVTSIGYNVFYDCYDLSDIYLNWKTPTVVKLGSNIFYEAPTSTCKLHIPAGSKVLYTAANQWKDFTNIVETPVYNIDASANISANVTILGIDSYTKGSDCTLTATPKTGYVFTGWTENGTVVSTNSSYTFTVSAARSLVANFSTVTVAVTQPTAATLSGSIVVTPSTGFTYSLDGKTYQSSNEFPYVSIGTYNVTLKNVSDGTVSSPVLAVVNASGVVAANNYQIKASNCTCRDTKDGAIAVTLAKALDYTVTVTATSTGSEQSVMFSGTSYNLKNLPADTYKLVFKIDFLDNYEQSFNVVVTQPDDLSVLKVSAEKSRATYTLSGGANYYVSVNDNTTETQGDQVQVSLVAGENKIKIYTEKLCQGVYEETIYNSESGQISIFPNPTTGKITLGIPGEEESVTAEIVSLSGAVQLEQKLVVPASRLVDIDVSDFIRGTYIVKLNGSTVHSSVKMIKK